MIRPAWASLSLEPRIADHRSQAARTATVPTAPPRQAPSAPHPRTFFPVIPASIHQHTFVVDSCVELTVNDKINLIQQQTVYGGANQIKVMWKL